MLLSREQLDQYHRDGYVIIDAPFSPKLTDDCLAAVARYGRDPAEVIEASGQWQRYMLMPAAPGSVFSILDHSLPFLRVSLHPEIVEIARQIEGENDVYFRNGGINELPPGNAVGWHFDTHLEYAEFMHYFNDADVSNGCLRVIPGSHRPRADHLREQIVETRRRLGYSDGSARLDAADVELPGEVPLAVGSDKLIIRSSQILHATHRNDSPRGRLMQHWLYHKVRDGGFRFNWSHYLTPELIAELSSEQRTLLRLNHEDPIDEGYRAETERERGKAVWSVV